MSIYIYSVVPIIVGCSYVYSYHGLIFQVYVFDPKGPADTQTCCLRKLKIQEEFPAVENSIPLPDNLDAVYYSYDDDSMYFIKDEDVWKNVAFHKRQKHIKNGVLYMGKWFDKWFDICDVNTHANHFLSMFDFQKHSW